VKVVITGGAGYIGSVMTETFIGAGHSVTIIDNLSRGFREAVHKEAKFIEADVRDFAKVISASDNIDAVVHLAAYAYVGESVRKPEIYWDNNVVGTLGLLDGMRKLGIKNLVFAYDTTDGSCIRDYIHVTDLVNAALLAVEKAKKGEHNIYNLGNGTGFSNKEVIGVVEKVTGKKIKVAIEDRRPGDPAALVASSEKIISDLGWKPSKPNLEDMVADAWEFYQKVKP
jgi:UDP-glucose 4-epimerase